MNKDKDMFCKNWLCWLSIGVVILLVLFFFPKNLTKIRVVETDKNGRTIEKIEEYICCGVKYERAKDNCVYYNCKHHYCLGLIFGTSYFEMADGVIIPIGEDGKW